MSTPTTTPAAIRAALVTLIEAVTPTHTEFSDVGWDHIPDEAPRGFRNFRILTLPGSVDPEGIYGGDGVEVFQPLVIRVAYEGIDDNDAFDLITRDCLDLWTQALHPSPGGNAQNIAGLIAFQDFLVPELNDEDSNHLICDFITEVHYKAAL